MAGGKERASAAVLDREGCGDNLLGKYGDGADACLHKAGKAMRGVGHPVRWVVDDREKQTAMKRCRGHMDNDLQNFTAIFRQRQASA